MKFPTTVVLGGKTATGFEVPEAVVSALGVGKKPPVVVTVGGHSYRSTIGVMGGKFMIPLSAENRTAATLSAGDQVEVDLQLDTEPREIAAPADLAAALDAEPKARKAFDALSYSHKRQHVMAIDAAKSAPTRQRRIDGTIEKLVAG